MNIVLCLVRKLVVNHALDVLPIKELIKSSSRAHQELIKSSSRAHQEVIKRSSRAHQELIKRSSSGHQAVIKRTLAHSEAPYRYVEAARGNVRRDEHWHHAAAEFG